MQGPDGSGVYSSARGDVCLDDGAVPHSGAGSDADPQVDGGAHADLAEIIDPYLPGQQRSRGKVHAFSGDAFMGKDHPRVDECPEAHGAFGADVALCQDLDPIGKTNIVLHKGGRVDQGRETEAAFPQKLKNVPNICLLFNQ